MNYERHRLYTDESYDPHKPVRTGVNLRDYKEVLTDIVPEIVVYDDPQYGGFKVTYQFNLHLQENFAVSEQHAREIMKSLGETIRITVARDLGLRPIMDAYEREGEQLRRSIRTLEDNARRLTEQNQLLAALLEERRSEDGDE